MVGFIRSPLWESAPCGPAENKDEAMNSVKVLAVAGTAMLIALPAAYAADLPPIAPPPHQPYVDFGGWYLRGDIGITNQKVGNLDNVLYATAVGLQQVDRAFDSAGLFGLGIGYEFNSWLRADITGEFRSSANFHGLDIYGTPPAGTDEYRGRKHEWLFLANVYVDLGTWWNVTPFIGAGLGFSNNTIASFLDVNTPTAGVAYAADTSKTSFAWALHAGFSYRVTNNFTVELAYRYVNLGDATTGDLIPYTGVNTIDNPMLFNDLSSHDVKLGVRWYLAPIESEPPPPLMRKG
jgi:opacity protein-like surface antigen